MAIIKFPWHEDANKNEDVFGKLVGYHMNLIQRFLVMTYSMPHLVVERISYVDLAERKFHEGFHYNEELEIHNTSTLDKFGFGSWSGYFFDVIVRCDMAAVGRMNIRVFYGLRTSPDSAKQDASHIDPIKPEVVESEQAPADAIFILGANRKFFKKGRATYIEYDGRLITMTEAKKLEKKQNSINGQDIVQVQTLLHNGE